MLSSLTISPGSRCASKCAKQMNFVYSDLMESFRLLRHWMLQALMSIIVPSVWIGLSSCSIDCLPQRRTNSRYQYYISIMFFTKETQIGAQVMLIKVVDILSLRLYRPCHVESRSGKTRQWQHWPSRRVSISCRSPRVSYRSRES